MEHKKNNKNPKDPTSLVAKAMADINLDTKTIKHTFSSFSPHRLPRICKPIFVLYHFWPSLIGGAQTMGHSHIQIDYVNEVDKELLVLKF
jgi:hypothetical protein